MFYRNHGFQVPIQEHQYRARDTANRAVIESSDPYETALMMKLRVAQLDNESTTELRERVKFSESEAMLKQHCGKWPNVINIQQQSSEFQITLRDINVRLTKEIKHNWIPKCYVRHLFLVVLTFAHLFSNSDT